jgi:hypothetical protein
MPLTNVFTVEQGTQVARAAVVHTAIVAAVSTVSEGYCSLGHGDCHDARIYSHNVAEISEMDVNRKRKTRTKVGKRQIRIIS